MGVRCIGACLDLKVMLVSSYLALVDHHTLFVFALLEFLIPVSRDLPTYVKDDQN
jgi:hypothetical protein